jgi:hypothetical protein
MFDYIANKTISSDHTGQARIIHCRLLYPIQQLRLSPGALCHESQILSFDVTETMSCLMSPESRDAQASRRTRDHVSLPIHSPKRCLDFALCTTVKVHGTSNETSAVCRSRRHLTSTPIQDRTTACNRMHEYALGKGSTTSVFRVPIGDSSASTATGSLFWVQTRYSLL